MGVIEIAGDILTPPNPTQPTVICHQVNCMGVMGSGLAKQIRTQYPQVYEDYMDFCDDEKIVSLLGHVLFSPINENLIIANLFGQDDYGYDNKRYTNYMALRKALEEVALEYDGYTIRIPYKMGCGLGGGNWTVVTQIIRETLLNNDINVEIWRIE